MANDFGGYEMKTDAQESVAEISMNRTLFLEKFTNEPPFVPAVVHNLQNMEQVFQHFKPELSFFFEDAEKGITKETLRFSRLSDFSVENIKKQSKFLKEKEIQKEGYIKIANKLQSEKQLKAVIENDEKKALLINAVDALIAELKSISHQ